MPNLQCTVAMIVSFGRGSCSGNASKKAFLGLNVKDLVTVVGYRLKRGVGKRSTYSYIPCQSSLAQGHVHTLGNPLTVVLTDVIGECAFIIRSKEWMINPKLEEYLPPKSLSPPNWTVAF